MKKIFAVTISFNNEDVTTNWLDSMQKVKTRGFTLDLVIVDNASTVKFTLSNNRQKENVHLIRSEENSGFTGGNNIGIQYALKHGADYVLIINNDTVVDEHLVENLLGALDSNPQIGIVVPKIYFAKGHEFHKDRYKKEELGKVFWYAGGFIDWKNVMSVHRGVDEVDRGQYNKQEIITFASGCCMMIPKNVLEKVGLFDEEYFLYFEDSGLSERIKRAGYKIVYVPSAVLWHINAGSTGGSGSLLQDYFMTRNRMLFGMRYAPLRSKLALIRESMRFIISGRPMQKKGIKDFYLGKFGKGSYFV